MSLRMAIFHSLLRLSNIPLSIYTPPLLPTFFPISVFLSSLAALGLRCRLRAFSSCGKQELLSVAVLTPSLAVASLAAACGLRSCGCTGLVALRPVESSWARDRTRAPCNVRRVLNLWTTKGVPNCDLLQDTEHSSLCYSVGPCGLFHIK